MQTVQLHKIKYSYNKETKTFTMSERDVKFDTTYELFNEKTRGTMKFEFSHSTGAEFDKNTKWIYKADVGCILEVCNDERMVLEAERNYLIGKGIIPSPYSGPMPNLKGNPAYDLMM